MVNVCLSPASRSDASCFHCGQAAVSRAPTGLDSVSSASLLEGFSEHMVKNGDELRFHSVHEIILVTAVCFSFNSSERRTGSQAGGAGPQRARRRRAPQARMHGRRASAGGHGGGKGHGEVKQCCTWNGRFLLLGGGALS